MIPPTPREIELVGKLREIINELKTAGGRWPEMWQAGLRSADIGTQQLEITITRCQLAQIVAKLKL